MKKILFILFFFLIFPHFSWSKEKKQNISLSEVQIHQSFFKQDLKKIEEWLKQNEKIKTPSKQFLLYKAYFLLEQKKYAEAYLLFQNLKNDFPKLSRSLSLWIIESANYSGNYAQAKLEMKKFEEQNPEYLQTSFWFAHSLLLKCVEEKNENALLEIEKKIKSNPSLILFETWKSCATALNQPRSREGQLTQWFESGALGLNISELNELFQGFSPQLLQQLNYENYFRRWNALKIQNRNLEAGKEMFAYFTSHPYLTEQLPWIATSLYDSRLYAESAVFYEKWIKEKNLNTDQNWEVLDKLGSAYFRSNQFEKAYQNRKNLLSSSPENKKEKLHYYLGFILFDAGKYSQAIQEFQSFLNAFPKTTYSEEALFKMGFAYHQLNDKENAQNTFTQLMTNFPNSSEAKRSAFWLIQNKTQNTSEKIIDQAQQIMSSQTFNTEWKKRFGLKTCPKFSPHSQDPSHPLLEELSQNFPSSHQVELKTLLDFGFFNEFWFLSEPLLKNNFSLDEIKNWAKFISLKNGLDPKIILGLIKQESQFKVQAKSEANAMGLMQLIPQTALETAKTLKLETYETSQLYHVILNLRLGNQYFYSLLEQLEGNIPQTIAAYNAGPEAVARWNHKKEETCLEWMEEIPFKETYQYVRKVLLNSWNN